MPITAEEAKNIASRINPIFMEVLKEYDFRKYPADDYARFKRSFSSMGNPNHDINEALIWKWGHWGKPNYPKHHQNLASEIHGLWHHFLKSGSCTNAELTFQWWQARLTKRTRYITVSYITHLVHYAEPLPIIDQHNFRAMNALIGEVRPNWKATKKKPSNWQDISTLKAFMTAILAAMPGPNFGELDRFLMMYGKSHVPR